MDNFRACGNLNKLTTAKGATWEIKSDTVKLRDHVVHTVTITGVVSNATTQGVKKCTLRRFLGTPNLRAFKKPGHVNSALKRRAPGDPPPTYATIPGNGLHDRCRRQTIPGNPPTKPIYEGPAFAANSVSNCIYETYDLCGYLHRIR